MRLEREVFDALVRRHHAAVYRTARRIVRSDADAADVAQQVFLLAWRGRSDLRAVLHSGDAAAIEGRLRWLSSRLALNALRAARRRRRHEEETAVMHPESTASPSGTPAAADELRTVAAQVDALDDVHRATVVLRYGEGMTLAAIGTEMGCSESTVHGRLAAALDALRRRLRDAGFGGAVARLEGLLAVPAPVAVPAALETTLLAIPAAASTLPLLPIAAAAVLGLGGFAVYAASGAPVELARLSAPAAVEQANAGVDDFGPGAGAAVAAQEPAAQEPGRARQPVTPAAQDPSPASRDEALASAPRAFVSGLVIGEGGDPLADTDVVAWCRELSRKADPFEVRARTDARGAFALELPITHQDGLGYHLRAQRADWAGEFATPDVYLRANDQRRADAVMRRWAADEAGTWTADARVTDGGGRPVAGTIVSVFRRMLDREGKEKLVQETGGRTDDGGSLRLQGDHLGEKLVRVIPFGKPFAPLERTLPVRSATPEPMQFELAADVPLAVRVVDVRTNQPVARMIVTAERDGDTVAVGNSAADGTLVLRGIDAQAVTLTGGGLSFGERGGWSRFELADVWPGRGEVVLRCKRADDPENVGLHGAELHGRVVDAETGEPLAVEWGCVGTWWADPASPATSASLAAEAITPAPYQTCGVDDPPPPSADFHLQVAPGYYAVMLRTKGRAVAFLGPFHVAPNQVLAGLELRAEIGSRVEVVVRDSAGAPVEGAEVWLASPGAGPSAARAERAVELGRDAESKRRSLGGRGAYSDAGGRAVFEHVPSGIEFAVHVAHKSRRHGCSAAFTLRRGEAAAAQAVVVR